MSRRTQVQVPVTRFAVPYEVGGSRPYSRFEQLLLKAIDDGARTPMSLSHTFGVPNRLVIEGVVTLIEAGWVGLRSDNNELVTTPRGQAALTAGAAPTTLTVHRPYPQHVVMERVTGSYCRHDAVVLLHRAQLDLPDGRRVVRLPAEVHDNHIDPVDVRPLLRVPPGQWVRWISSDAQLAKGSQYAVGSYDPDEGRLTNLPEAFRAALEPLVAAQFGAPHAPSVSMPAVHEDTRRCRVALGAEDLVVNGAEHAALLRRALLEATKSVIVCSAFVTSRVLKSLEKEIAAALQRGATIDLLWGYSGGDTPAALDAIKKAQYDNQGAPGTLTCNREPSGSHAKLLVWDSAQYGAHACIGSYNWLSAGETMLGELSVCIHHPGVIADLMRFAAERWLDVPGSHLDSTPRRLERLAATCEEHWMQQEEPEAGAIASLVYGRGHESALRRAVMDTSPEVLIVMSHRVAPVGLRRLAEGSSLARESFDGAVVAGEALEEVKPAEVAELAGSLGMRFLERPMHAKALIHRDSVTVGSYNYLSADPPSRGGRARELSLRLEGETVRDLVQARLPEVWEPAAAGRDGATDV